MAKSRLLYLAALVGTLIFHTYYTGWFSWYLLMLLVILPWFSLLCSLYGILHLRLHVEMPAHCARAQPVFLRLGATNASLLAPPYRFQVVILDCMAQDSYRQKIALSGSKTAQIELPSAHSGAYLCTLEKGRVYDYLGLFVLPLHLPAAGELQVWPTSRAPREIPSLSELHSRAFRAKTAGGFSELHDFRAYRPGDSMRDIHWKLSAKTDKLIVREPLEPVRGQTIVSFDLSGSREQIDSVLDQLLWLCSWLLEQDITHSVCYLQPRTYVPQTAFIETQGDIQSLVVSLLRTGLAEDTPSIAARSFPAADWRYHIRPLEKEAVV